MSGVLTAHSMRLTTPHIAKRALGPHLGDFYEKFFPYWKCPRIFCNTRKGRKEMIVDKVKVSSGIAGLMSYDPGRLFCLDYLLFFTTFSIWNVCRKGHKEQ